MLIPAVQLQFHYSKEYELERVRYTLSRADFYKSNGYTPTLPAGLDLERGSDSDALESVVREYDNEYFAYYEDSLLSKCREHDGILQSMEKAGIIRGDPPYVIYLTRYGVGGSYGPPDEVVLKVWEREVSDRGFGTLLHELVHLHINNWVVEHELSHWQKERLVDLIGLKFFPSLRPAQTIKEDVLLVDTAFAAAYPDLKKVIALVENRD